MGLFNLGTKAGSTAQHLLKQNAGLDPAHKDQGGDLRHIDTGGQQVNGNGNTGETLVFEAFDRLLHLLGVTATHAAGDLHNGIVIHTIL